MPLEPNSAQHHPQYTGTAAPLDTMMRALANTTEDMQRIDNWWHAPIMRRGHIHRLLRYDANQRRGVGSGVASAQANGGGGWLRERGAAG